MLNTENLALIAKDEAMVAFCRSDRGYSYNISYSGRLDTDEVVKIIDKETDDCFKIVCIDTVTNQVDDITELVAEAYINKHLNQFEQDDYVPPFVASSDAWDKHLQYIKEQEAIDAKYGTYEEQHRLRLSDVL